MENKKYKKIVIILSIIIVILVVIITALLIKQKSTKKDVESVGNDYSNVKTNKTNNKKTENANDIKYTEEQLKEEIYSFIERRKDYAVMNIKGNDLSQILNSDGKMVDIRKVTNYGYGLGKEMTITEYDIEYKRGEHFMKIYADPKDDKIIGIHYYCGFSSEQIDKGMSIMFEALKTQLNTNEDMSFWEFDNKKSGWQSGNIALYEKGLGIKVDGFYDFYIVACPTKDFYKAYSTNL